MGIKLAGNDGDVQWVRAGTAADACVVAPAAGPTDIVAQTRHSCRQYKQA